MDSLFDKVQDVRSLAQVIVDTVREPLLVLDSQAKILAASGSFRRTFQVGSENILYQQLFALDGNAWDIPSLHTLLERTLSGSEPVEGFEVIHEFPRIGTRVLLLHARKALYEENLGTLLLLGFEDITDRRVIEQEKAVLQLKTDDLLLQKEMLLSEMHHRIVNSLQIIASVLMLKARAVSSDETREHLKDAHRRVMSIAAVQQHLHGAAREDLIEIGPYLTKLCGSLADSMIGERSAATLRVVSDDVQLASADAISLGLIVTELVINALKYAFPGQEKAPLVTVHYEINGAAWQLTVMDNGAGKPANRPASAKGGLGTSIVKALAYQLDAQVETASSTSGLRVSITHATFTPRAQPAADRRDHPFFEGAKSC